MQDKEREILLKILCKEYKIIEANLYHVRQLILLKGGKITKTNKSLKCKKNQ